MGPGGQKGFVGVVRDWEGQNATPDPQQWHKGLASLAEPHQPRD